MSSDLRALRELEPVFYRAPSAHNTQPWLLEYSPDRVDLGFDRARELPLGDPTRRDLLLSLGAFVEAVLIASADAGVAVEFEPALDLERARVGAFRAAAAPYGTPFTRGDLERRQTSRLRYEDARLTEEDLGAARAVLGADVTLHELEGRNIVDLYVAGDRHLYDAPAVVEELRSWLRLSRRHPRYEHDGLSSECLALPRAGAVALGFLLRPRVYPLARAVRIPRLFTAATKSDVARGSVVVLTSSSHGPEALLDHGRCLLRVWLALAKRDLYTHPLSQIVDHAAAELAARVGERPFAVLRAGRSEPPARSARLR